ncbi:MAG TPA: hypothetical protein PK620_03325 [Denitromonas sp.]|uniref:hypothetical protein n=1 Tax=Denitromonas sp. TaxID=2734609 RepID=UPI001DBECFDD|nr:hypothetical protein [Rhodocyclaceae bacterium]MCP5223425.1 hypothetical protein [Zoogloeaceae bacterium]HQU89091.1 hypothetical protein [Denitromonas sp.]HQV13924.1 hypothetical protein [Denitromonas sp.]
MPIATFRGEKSVSAIADKLFVKLTPKQREKAEAALIKENPQLRELGTVPQGAILRVPELPELRAKTNRSLENPDTQIARNLADAISAYGNHLGERFKTVQKEGKEQLAVLKSGDMRKAMAEAPALKALADEAGKALEARAAGLGDRQKAADAAIKQAIAALDVGKR